MLSFLLEFLALWRHFGLFKNESLQLELSESATPDSTQRRNGGGSAAPRQETSQPAQLSAILAPNSLLYDDLDNIIDNDEDVQVIRPSSRWFATLWIQNSL